MKLATCALVFLAASCTTIRHDYAGPREITPGTKLSRSSHKVSAVEGDKRAKFLLWGLIDLNSASAAEFLDAKAQAAHADGFDGITRVRIHEEIGFWDGVVNLITLGIFTMKTVEATGEVHRFSAGGAQ